MDLPRYNHKNSKNITEIRIEIDKKLENETRKLKNFKEERAKLQKVTKNMTELLSIMEKRFATLKNNPILNSMLNHQCVHNNEKGILAALDYYCVTQDVHGIVCVKLGSDLENLDIFLVAMHRLQKSLNYLEKHNPQSDEIYKITNMLIIGRNNLENYFQKLLLKNNGPVSPNKLINNDDDDALRGDGASDLWTDNLKAMAAWLVSQGRFEFLQMYKIARFATFMTSYDAVKKLHPLGTEASVQGVEDVSSGFVQVVEFLEDKVDQQEMESYVICVMALLKLMRNERSLMSGIIPLECHHQVLQFIILEALVSSVQDGFIIAARAEKYFNLVGFTVVSMLLFVIKELRSMEFEFDQILTGCDYKVVFKFTNNIKNLCKTVAKMLDYKITDHFRSNPSPGLPQDVAVHEMTISVLNFLEHLMEYTDIVADILRENCICISSFPSKNIYKNRALLGVYIIKVLSELDKWFLLKSYDFMNSHVSKLFCLVNRQHVLKVLNQSCMLELVDISQPDYIHSYKDQMMREVNKN